MHQFEWISWNVSSTITMPRNIVKVDNEMFIIRANKPGTKEFYYGKFNFKTKSAQMIKPYGLLNVTDFQVTKKILSFVNNQIMIKLIVLVIDSR